MISSELITMYVASWSSSAGPSISSSSEDNLPLLIRNNRETIDLQVLTAKNAHINPLHNQ